MTYYDNGSLKSKQELLDGKRDGVFQEYSATGNLLRSGVADKGIIREMTYFYETGRIKQVQRYDRDGTIISAERFSEDGNRDSTAFPFLYINETDTLKKNQNAALKARMLNTIDPIYDNGKLLITSKFDTTQSDDLKLTDTLAIVSTDRQNNFVYKLNTQSMGDNIVYGQFIFSKVVGSKMYVVSHEFQYPYFVKE